jgi:muconate cycloisomerase
MKITAVELFRIAIPFKVPYALSRRYGTLTHAEAVVLKVHTDAGLVGLGEADPKNPFTEETPGSVIAAIGELLAPHLLGRDPRRMAAIEADIDRAVHGHLMARGAVNMALYDLLGKIHDLPVHTFLGGLRRQRLPLLGPIGSGTSDQDGETIDALIEEGYRTVMIKMGALPIRREIERMVHASQRYGGRIVLIADANQGWEFKETLRFLDGVRGAEPTLLEQPVTRNRIDALQAIRSRTACLLSADESLVGIDDAVALIRAEAVDVFSIKVSKNGGLTRSLRLARLAEAFGIRCLMNSMLEFGITQAASLQLGCTLDNLLDCGHAYMSVLRMADDITDFGRLIEEATVTVPPSAGLGVTVDDEKLRAYTQAHARIE